ncbi:hypothetical protein K458DRAFT_406970 [Lentithecium fluviatile CBS 122367]|uniref:F-box domain-containing protein n=1 Tax=Lentithecium fluviatile CBS 122367 TaxID=1168545 RepID=A0A6G1IS75_9PLEO|nr:hypothetical protein K458DRAFT_406970 [Lentithecium fluviatile CBS 122367]
MTLHTLPAEVRLAIAELLDARTCFKFALASREDYRLYSSLLAEYKALFARYNTIDTHNAGRLVWDVTNEIIERPEIAQYVEDVSFPLTRQSVWDEDLYLDRSDISPNTPSIVPENVVRLYADAAMKNPILQEVSEKCDYVRMNWSMEQTMRIGSDEPIAALLVAMATNLRTLRFTEFSINYEFLELVQRTVLASADPVKPPSLPFQNLTFAAIACEDTEGCCKARWADLFISLPSLRGFAADKIGGSLDPWWEESKSNVKDIRFQFSLFDPEALEAILGRIRSLRSFSYEDGGAIVSEEGCFASRRVTAALLKYAAHSLEELILSDEQGEEMDDYREIDRVSLRGFAKLRTLRCSWSTITVEEPEWSEPDEPLPGGKFYTNKTSAQGRLENLAHRLPRSLEALHVEVEPDDEDCEAFVNMIRKSQSILPNLAHVHVQSKRNGKSVGSSVPGLLDALKERGISYDEESGFSSVYQASLARLLYGQGGF